MTSGPDRTRALLRGSACGVTAAVVWALSQPLDKLAFACRYDDVELLGRAVVRGEGWYPVGLAMHMGNGALFGALYTRLAPRLPLPPVARGPALAMAEHLLTWPLVGLVDRFHPAREKLPTLTGNRNGFLQATWRHLLFGLVLGELERRINGQPEEPTAEPEVDYSSNGHGSIEHAVSAR